MTQLKNITALVIYPILIISFFIIISVMNPEDENSITKPNIPVVMSYMEEKSNVIVKSKAMSYNKETEHKKGDILQLIKNIQILNEEIKKLKK